MADEKKHKKEMTEKAENNATNKSEERTEKQPKEDVKLIVRVGNNDLDGKKSIPRALLKIKGLGIRSARNLAITFEKEAGISSDEKLGKLTEEQIKQLEEIMLNPVKNGIPEWSLNRQKDFTTGENKHLVMSDLDFALRNDFQRLNEIKSYRGLRHVWGQPVRGQKTKSTHRGRGNAVVGVVKKDKKK